MTAIDNGGPAFPGEKRELKHCPFCGNEDRELLAYGPSGDTKELRDIYQATYCLKCEAKGPSAERRDGLFTAARDAWNRRSPVLGNTEQQILPTGGAGSPAVNRSN